MCTWWLPPWHHLGVGSAVPRRKAGLYASDEGADFSGVRVIALCHLLRQEEHVER